MAHTLRDAYSRAHAQAGVAHIERRRVAERVAADIAAVDRLLPAHRLLDGIERCPVGTSRAQYRRSDRQRRRSGKRVRHICGALALLPCKNSDRRIHDLHRVLSRGRDVAGELAADLYIQAVFPAYIGESTLDHGIKFLDAEHLVQPLHELKRKLLREGERRRDSHDPYVPAAQGIQRVHEVDALRRDAEAAGFLSRCAGLRDDPVAVVFGEYVLQLRVPLLDQGMVLHGQPGEDDPSGRILYESLIAVHIVFLRIPDFHRLVAVVDAGRSAEENGRSVF